MGKSTEMTYDIIKELNISLAMVASGKSETAQRAVDFQSSTVWSQTVAVCMEAIDLSAVSKDTSKEAIKALQQQLKDVLIANILEKTVIPEQGKNREGKTFQVTDPKTGNVKWSSWDQTRRIMAYSGDVAKIIMFDKADLLYPERFKVGARSEVLKLCKVVASPMENIVRLCKDLQEWGNVVEGSDVQASHDLIESIRVADVKPVNEALGLISRLSGVITGLDSIEMDAVKSALISLASELK